MLMFWVTDNFLMHKSRTSRRLRRDSVEDSLLTRTKVKYRTIKKKARRRDPESDILLSGDDELLDSESTPINRHVMA